MEVLQIIGWALSVITGLFLGKGAIDKIVRLKGKKRAKVSYPQSRDNRFLKKLNNPNVIKYISITNPDKSGIDNLLYAAKRYNPD
jgi:transcriptional regulatory protein LevR